MRLLVLLIPSIVATSAVAQTEDELNRSAREIFETVLSPYCPGRTISNCPSPQADELRANIRQQLATGETPDEVKEELYSVFGDEMRTIPRARGFGLLAWAVPAIAFLLGGWAILVWVRRTRAPQAATDNPELAQLDPEVDARIAAEMAELE
jgi:cytochrome c-type biogenesis protein CcmH